MNRLIAFFLTTALLTAPSLFAQDEDLGAAAIASTDVVKTSEWQNWAFAGTFLVTATAGVLAASLDNGSTAH